MFGWGGSYQVVREGQAGVLYRDGVYVRTLPPGRHWVRHRQLLTAVATAEQMLELGGQEVLSADGFLPRVSATALFTVTDPHRALSAEASYRDRLILEVQLALRALVNARAAEALAKAPRAELDSELLAAVHLAATGIGLAVASVRVRDVILPPDLRRLLTGVEKGPAGRPGNAGTGPCRAGGTPLARERGADAAEQPRTAEP